MHDTALTVDELRQRSLKARTLLGEIRALFPEAHSAARAEAGTGDGTGGTSGGCSTSGSAPGFLVVAALGLLRRRRARR